MVRKRKREKRRVVFRLSNNTQVIALISRKEVTVNIRSKGK